MLNRLLERILEEEPGRPVLECCGRFWTARELDDSASALAGSLSQSGLEAIDRVAMLLPNCAEAVLAYLACFKAGFVIVPLDYRHRAEQLRYALGHSGASVLIVHRDRLAELEEAGVLGVVPKVLVVGEAPGAARHEKFGDYLLPRASCPGEIVFADDDLSVMIYTSGTTSRPKGVTLTRGALASGITMYLARVPLSKEDVALVAGPITRPMALRSQLLPVLAVGGCVTLLEQFSADAYVAALARPPAKTFLSLLPSGLGQVLRHPDIARCDFGSLRLCIAGGDRVAPRLHEEFHELTGVELTEQCGASEVGVYAVAPPFGRKKPGSIGLPMYGSRVRIVDENGRDIASGKTGEILVSSPMMMDGYWNDTAQTRKTLTRGEVRTGDLGRYDEDGYLWFMGRKKDVIVRGGSNVSPLEVEAALLDYPGVVDACVIGLLDAELGQRVYAFVVPGAEIALGELMVFLRGRLAEYMVPEGIQFVDRLPLKGPGKIDRDLLKMQAQIGSLMETVPFFRSASDDFLRDVVPYLECMEFDAGEVVFRHGEPGEAMYFLTRGAVDVVAGDGLTSLAELRQGTYFGELAVLRATRRSATIRVTEACEVYQLKRGAVTVLAGKYPEFARHLHEAMAGYGEKGSGSS